MLPTTHSLDDGQDPPAPRAEDCRILVIDDSSLTVRVIKTFLGKDGYAAIHGVTDPAEAERAFAELRPDIVLLDVSMPGLDGFAVLEQLQAQAGQRFAPIFLSAATEREVRTRALERGASDFIAKPIEENELRLRVRNQARIIAVERMLAAQNDRLAQAVAERTAKLQEAINVLRRTEAKLSEDLRQAREKSSDKMSFFANVNHEMRTPLNAIIGFAEVIKEERLGPLGHEKYRDYVGEIHQAGQHLQRLIGDLLDLSRTEVHDFQLDIRPVDPSDAIRAGVAMVEEQARRAGITLVVDIEPGLPIIQTDAGRLKQIVINLASNAVKFTPSGGRVTVKAKKDEDRGILILAISDTGVGIAPENLEMVFKPFGRVKPIRIVRGAADQPASTGLGLAITKRLVELMGGSIAVQSRPNIGTIVTVRLPLRAG